MFHFSLIPFRFDQLDVFLLIRLFPTMFPSSSVLSILSTSKVLSYLIYKTLYHRHPSIYYFYPLFLFFVSPVPLALSLPYSLGGRFDRFVIAEWTKLTFYGEVSWVVTGNRVTLTRLTNAIPISLICLSLRGSFSRGHEAPRNCLLDRILCARVNEARNKRNEQSGGKWQEERRRRERE